MTGWPITKNVRCVVQRDHGRAGCAAGAESCAGSRASGAGTAAYRNALYRIVRRRMTDDKTAGRPKVCRRFQLVKKTRSVRGAHAAKKVKSVFSGDMCVGENTSRSANVQFVRQRRTNCALRQTAAACRKRRQPFSTA